jgi:transitional endoplasmic reticulum ATPase
MDNYLLSKQYSVNSKYTVLFPIKQSVNAQSYRVKCNKGNLYFLKLFNFSKLHRTAFDSEGNILEIEFLKKIKHPNIVKYHDSGELIIEHQRYAFLVLEFISGETLSDKLVRETTINIFDVKKYVVSVLNGLQHIHSLAEPIIHNEITIQNVMLDLSADEAIPKIIDFGYSRSFHQSTKCFYKDGLSPYYLAPECQNNAFSPQSDVFSAGALMYHLLFGLPPWFQEISNFKAERSNNVEAIFEARKKKLSFPNLDKEGINYDENFLNIIKKALHTDTEIRFKSANEMLLALNGETVVEDVYSQTKPLNKNTTEKKEEKKKFSPKAKGSGFSRIAGMRELKDKLLNDVIELLNDSEGAEKYGLSIPNGMLLYGPPGCGKTFFAERFAEEAGFNYKYIRSSDLASIYVHGSQEKIGKLFKEARENAPMILCFDELDALVPKRDKVNTSSQSGEVNEFLTQLNNCGEDGIFVIGTTNNPQSIDQAVMRSGRMDIKVYIPLPDFEARKALFELYLKDKPLDFGMDYDKLASLTENFVISDIVLIVQEVGRSVFKSRERLSMNLLLSAISKAKPSVSMEEIDRYEKIKQKIEGEQITQNETKRTPVGFKTNNKS